MPYAVELGLQLLDLRHDLVESADLGVGIINQVPRGIVVDHRDDLGLLGQVIELLPDLLHQPVKVPPKLRERAAVEYQYAL